MSSTVVVSRSILGITMSLSKSISSSIVLPVRNFFNGVFGFTSVPTSLALEIETIVDEARLPNKPWIGPTRGRLRDVLTVSKIDVPSKTGVPIGNVQARIFTIEELTSTKIGATEAVVNKIVEQTGKLAVHAIVEVDIIEELTTIDITKVDDSIVDEEGCSSVDEVVNTSIANTWSYDVAGADDISDVDAINPIEADSNLDDMIVLGGEWGRDAITTTVIFIGSSSSLSSSLASSSFSSSSFSFINSYKSSLVTSIVIDGV